MSMLVLMHGVCQPDSRLLIQWVIGSPGGDVFDIEHVGRLVCSPVAKDLWERPSGRDCSSGRRVVASNRALKCAPTAGATRRRQTARAARRGRRDIKSSSREE